MDIFDIHNSHWEDAQQFSSLDVHLRRLRKLQYVYHAPLLQELPRTIPGIYNLGGGRQIGKTTLLKQWMYCLLQEGHDPHSLVFLTGEIIDDYQILIRTLQEILTKMTKSPFKYLIIDEVTYIKEWDKGIKFLADSGILDDVILILTGSDLTLMKEARVRFPGRRGQASVVDFTLYPVSFYEFVHLCYPQIEARTDILYQAFDAYLMHGGYLKAINDQAELGNIRPATYMAYADWIRGDVLKRNKSEATLRDFLTAIFNTYGTQVSWITLMHHTTIGHPHTLQEYAETMATMEALFIQSALIEDKLTAAPKKAKKLYFTDPFIYHALNFWLKLPQRIDITPIMVETVVINHIRRHWPTYYIKAEGEVDVAYIKNQRFYPVEIKWAQQLRPQEFKQIQKYSNGLILTKIPHPGQIGTVPTKPIPLFLYELKAE